MWVFSPVAEGVAVALPCDKLSVQIFTFAIASGETAPCSNWFPAAQGLFSELKREVERQNAAAHFSKTAPTAASALSPSLWYPSSSQVRPLPGFLQLLPDSATATATPIGYGVQCNWKNNWIFFFYARLARWTIQVVKLKRYWRHCKLPTGAGDQLAWNQSYT